MSSTGRPGTKTLAVLALAIAFGFATPMSARAEEGPPTVTPQPPTPTPTPTPVPTPTPLPLPPITPQQPTSQSIRTFVDGRSVVGVSSTGKELFRIGHMSVDHLEPPTGDLVELGRHRYYAYHCYLMQLDPVAGMVVRRAVFPGQIIEFASKGNKMTVIVKLKEGEVPKRVPYTYHPGRVVMAGLPIDDEAIKAPMIDAQQLIPGFSFNGFQYAYGREVALTKLRSGVLEESFRRNPTNPWYMFFKGMMLKHLDMQEQALLAFGRAVSVEGAPPFDYMRMSSVLAMVGETGEAIAAFERGFAAFVRAGLEPEQLMSRSAFRRYFAVQLGKGEKERSSHAMALQNAKTNGDSTSLMMLMDHAWRLAPRCDGIAYSFSGIAEELQERGRDEEAAVWFARARESASFSGPVGSRQAMYGATASLVALVVLFLVISGRTWRLQKKDLAPLGGWFSSWRWPKERIGRVSFAYAKRLELVGVLLVAALGFILSYVVITNERSVLRSMALPEEVRAGTWGHLNAVAAFENYRGHAGELLHGIACQQAGKLDDAKKIYESLRDAAPPRISAIAANNFGVIQAHVGEQNAALAAFKDALQRDPMLAEAKYNLDAKDFVDSLRVSRARAYRPGAALLALPDASILADAFASAPAPVDVPADAVRDDGLGLFRSLTYVTVALSVIMGVMSLLFMVVRRKPEPKFDKGSLGWLAYVVPWTSARFAPVGALLLGVWAYCLITIVQFIRLQFSSALMTPEQVEEIYGLSGSIVFPFESAIAIGGPVALIGLWVVNFLMVARSSTEVAKSSKHTQSIPVAKPPKATPPKSVPPKDDKPAEDEKKVDEKPADDVKDDDKKDEDDKGGDDEGEDDKPDTPTDSSSSDDESKD